MPFGLCGAPPAFQCFITWLFTHNPELSKEEEELINECLRWYVDNVIGHAETQEELVKVLRLVMKIFKQNHLFCKFSRCVFITEWVDFVGFVIGRNGVGMQGTKVKAIREWKSPNNAETNAKRRKENQKLLGFGNFYRRFINNYSALVKPLMNLTRKDVPWKWGDEEQAAFQGLKDAICVEPVLAHPDPETQYFMETNASGVAIGVILSQRQEAGYLHPIASRSQSFKLVERNYDTFDKELLAIVDSCKEWWLYLEGTKHKIIILTDHCYFQYWKDGHTFNRRDWRWHEMLPDLNLKIVYRPGVMSQNQIFCLEEAITPTSLPKNKSCCQQINLSDSGQTSSKICQLPLEKHKERTFHQRPWFPQFRESIPYLHRSANNSGTIIGRKNSCGIKAK